LRRTNAEADGEGGFADAWRAEEVRRDYHVAHAVGNRDDQEVLDQRKL